VRGVAVVEPVCTAGTVNALLPVIEAREPEYWGLGPAGQPSIGFWGNRLLRALSAPPRPSGGGRAGANRGGFLLAFKAIDASPFREV
jgi:hypothetical protein